ncbi:flavin reductase family protein [Natronorubrum daqingense]|uniref:Flavin reductase n=1 Tax=Natronorubrum daqingense TaxID=588898 RepID=A0A1N6XYX1_9EURY|nr:flavin reductase family protein [Natronorubrum daqingense]APX95828.1 flavin reductase [Natronorubrum daqingense]SIR07517.1 NADH-FMN oxidoreductase RutF, flavin reductase (DIM6/NTAB) family [Natronorubrum daqingense]
MTDDSRETLEIDVDDHEGSLYRVLSSAVVPRPIAWVSTRSPDGVDNLAPYSFFTVASVEPPVVLFAPVDGEDGLKDTPHNVRETEEFVINVVTDGLEVAMNETSASLPSDESEFDHADITRADSSVVDVARVAEAKIAFECTLRDLIDVGGSTLVLGDVRHVHLDESVTLEDRIDVTEVDAVGRLAGSLYARTDDRFGLERPP